VSRAAIVLIDLVPAGQTPEPSSHQNFERVVFNLKLPLCARRRARQPAPPQQVAAHKTRQRQKSSGGRKTMRFDRTKSSRIAVALVLAAVFTLPRHLVADAASHLVSPSELQQAAAEASTARQQNRDQVRKFFSTERAEKALRSAHLNPEQVKNAVSTLDDAELAQLASRVHKAQAEFAAGSLSDRDLIIILVAIAALILIIVAVR
jgi:hypothetical protein